MDEVTPEDKARAVMGKLIAAHLEGRDMRAMELSATDLEALAAFEVPAEDVRQMLLKQQRRRANKTKKRNRKTKKRNRRLAGGFIGTGDWRARPMVNPSAGRGKGSSKHTAYCG